MFYKVTNGSQESKRMYNVIRFMEVIPMFGPWLVNTGRQVRGRPIAYNFALSKFFICKS